MSLFPRRIGHLLSFARYMLVACVNVSSEEEEDFMEESDDDAEEEHDSVAVNMELPSARHAIA